MIGDQEEFPAIKVLVECLHTVDEGESFFFNLCIIRLTG